MVEITGMIAWGNGEPCPFCGEDVSGSHMTYLMSEHGEELNKALFPEA